jgi:hypothetical protein
MPTYLPPLRGISQSEALAEARAYATAGDPPLVTAALYFTTDAGLQAVYAVNDFEELQATLEADAPLDGGDEVTFQPVPMRARLPDETDDSPGSVAIEIDHVTRVLAPYLREATLRQDPILMMLRTYLPSDSSAPHETPPLTLELENAGANATTVSAQAGFGDLTNRRFPKAEYRPENYQGLSA